MPFHEKIPEDLDPVFGLATDTIWGLACLAKDKNAVSTIYKLKERDGEKPLVLLCSDLTMAQGLIELPGDLLPWLSRHWPGALTIICKARTDAYQHCHKGTPFLGVRIPNHFGALEFIKSQEQPVAATSFNLSGDKPVETREEALALFPCKVRQMIGTLNSMSSPSLVCMLDQRKFKILRATKEQKVTFFSKLPSRYSVDF